MKVLMLGWELPPHNSGGLGVACYELCKSLSQHNVDIDFIVPYQAEHNINFMRVSSANTEITFDDINFNAYGAAKNINSKNRNLFAEYELFTRKAINMISQKNFDIIHAHDWLTFKAALRIKQLRNRPLILHVHSVESDRSGNNRGNEIVREIEENAMHSADQIIAVSHHTKNKIISDYGLDPSKIDVVHNSINAIVEIDSGPNAYHYLTAMKLQGYKIVTNIGRLTVQKGLTNFLRSAQRVIAVHPKTLFLIVGSGEQYTELINLAAELGISDKVLFADFQRGKKWRDAFKIADLFVMPSVSEPFGLTPLEAINYGTPSLVSNQSGVSEVFKNCLKVDYWDIDEMSNLIASAIQSDAMLSELVDKASAEVELMSWTDSSRKIAEFYQRHQKLSEVSK